MTMDRNRTHVGAEAMQALLDGGLGRTEAHAAREHIDSCARCGSEFEAWSTLYRRLGRMEELAPSPDFAARVLDGLPRPEARRPPLVARISSWLGLGRPTKPVRIQGHLDVESIQDLLDGALEPARTAAMEAHLDGCRLCREDVDGWRGLMVRLEDLPRLEPSPVFAVRVMAHVRVQRVAAMARPSLRERMVTWLALNPRTRKRLAAMAGAGVTPAVTVALVAWTVFSHPLVTPANLLSFVWLKAQSVAAGLAGAVAAHVGQSGTLARLFELLEPLTRSAEAAAATATLLGALTVTAAWVLYRNLFAPDSPEHGYARVSF